MESRHLQFMDSKSSKFWRIELTGAAHTVTYGRLGTDGTAKTKEFPSEAKARESYEKLVRQKLAKGYADAETEPADAASDSSDDIPFLAFPCTKDDNCAHASNFMGLRVVGYKPKKKPADPAKTVNYFASEWEEDNFDTDLDHFLASDAAVEARGIVLGPWSDEMYDGDTAGIVKKLVDNKARLPKLAGIFLGDIVQEENEMSWINQCDVSPLLKAFPGLQLLRVRGGNRLSLSAAKHERLRALALETGGLDKAVLGSVLSGKFPNLEYLELWLGTEEYGGSCSVEDLQPLLAGKKFPKLRYLGLRNCDFVDDIAPVIVNSPLLGRLETLDLSLGNLSDVGGRALLGLPDSATLKKVNLRHNFLTSEVRKKLEKLPVSIDLSDVQEQDEDWRFVAVGE